MTDEITTFNTNPTRTREEVERALKSARKSLDWLSRQPERVQGNIYGPSLNRSIARLEKELASFTDAIDDMGWYSATHDISSKFRIGSDFHNKNAYKTFGITQDDAFKISSGETRPHINKIEVYGDGALRDRLVTLLNTPSAQATAEVREELINVIVDKYYAKDAADAILARFPSLTAPASAASFRAGVEAAANALATLPMKANEGAFQVIARATAVVRALTPPPASQDSGAEPVWYCAPSDFGKPIPRKWLLRYEDAEVGDRYFDNETDAYRAFEQANVGYSCWLFATVPTRTGQAPWISAPLTAAEVASPETTDVRERSFQDRVKPWILACFGLEISADRIERNHRFLEESLELVQSTGCTRSEAHQLVDYVYDRPVGETHQEIGGVMVTLAALCLAIGDDMHKAGEEELARIWTKVDKIRAKQAAKPKHSPLPEHIETTDIRERAKSRQIIRDQLHRMRKTGESFEMAARWICEELNKANLLRTPDIAATGELSADEIDAQYLSSLRNLCDHDDLTTINVYRRTVWALIRSYDALTAERERAEKAERDALAHKLIKETVAEAFDKAQSQVTRLTADLAARTGELEGAKSEIYKQVQFAEAEGYRWAEEKDRADALQQRVVALEETCKLARSQIDDMHVPDDILKTIDTAIAPASPNAKTEGV